MSFTAALLSIPTLYSFRKELITFFGVFFCVLMLPVLAVTIIANTGISAVSNSLVKKNPSSLAIQLFYPNGSPYKLINLHTDWPVRGVITLRFGESDLPFQPFHTGIDIANSHGRTGDPITPLMAGRVVHVGDLNWGFGKHVIVDNGDNVTTIYGHLDTVKVKEGEEVELGHIIGTEGQTGWATGPHLHLQVNVWGVPVDPMNFLNYQ